MTDAWWLVNHKNEHGPLDYEIDNLHWLYIGWENDHPKSWTFMGGALSPGKRDPIQYTVTIGNKTYYPDEFDEDRRAKINWYLASGYLPSPISEWYADTIKVEIQHFASRVLDDKVTAVYTRVGLTNDGDQRETIRLNINTGPDREVPLTNNPTSSDGHSMRYDVTIPAGKTMRFDFVARATGKASPTDLASVGSFDDMYERMGNYYNTRINCLARPVSLPDPELIEMYKAQQIVMWESIVKVGDAVEMRGSGGAPNRYYPYDRTFSHDVPNMVAQFIREGDFALAKSIMESEYYQKLGKELEQNYLDAIPKYIIPYALYLQFSQDMDYFTPSVKDKIKAAAHRIHEHRELDPKARGTGHYGIMCKSNSQDNGSDYLLVDNFAALHGLASYKFLCDALGDEKEAKWAQSEMEDLNRCVNEALECSTKRRGVDWYMACFDDDCRFWERGFYDGNYFAVSFLMSTFPWDASLKGFSLGGAWKDRLDRSVENALKMRDRSELNIPDGSWGAWWGHEYGSVYNAGMALQMLFSEKYRVLPIKHLKWLLRNQSAPYQWGESFDRGANGDWTRPAADYETWGLSFNKQTLLESNISVKTDGTVIIGRGVPNSWLQKGKAIEWKDVPITNNRRLSFRIETNQKSIILKLSGDERTANIIFNLPVFVNNVSNVILDGKTASSFRNSSGEILIPPKSKDANVPCTTTPRNSSATRPSSRDIMPLLKSIGLPAAVSPSYAPYRKITASTNRKTMKIIRP